MQTDFAKFAKFCFNPIVTPIFIKNKIKIFQIAQMYANGLNLESHIIFLIFPIVISKAPQTLHSSIFSYEFKMLVTFQLKT